MNDWIILFILVSPILFVICLVAHNEYSWRKREKDNERDLRIKNLINKL